MRDKFTRDKWVGERLTPVSVKLPKEHIDLIKASGKPLSKCIRDALDLYFGLVEAERETLLEIIDLRIEEKLNGHRKECISYSPEPGAAGIHVRRKPVHLQDNPAAIAEIKRLYLEGMPIKKIALLVKYHRDTVSKLIKTLKEAGELS